MVGSYERLAGDQGFEPQSSESESDVLPLNESPIFYLRLSLVVEEDVISLSRLLDSQGMPIARLALQALLAASLYCSSLDRLAILPTSPTSDWCPPLQVEGPTYVPRGLPGTVFHLVKLGRLHHSESGAIFGTPFGHPDVPGGVVPY